MGENTTTVGATDQDSGSAHKTDPIAVRRMVTIEVGQRLREARKAQGLSHADISERIKLSLSQIEALEQGDWERLPNDTFAIAFLRQYADHLGVDVEETVARLKSEALRFRHPLTFPDPAIAPNRKWAIASAALFVLLLLSWNLVDHDTPPPPPDDTEIVEEAQTPYPMEHRETDGSSASTPATTAQNDKTETTVTNNDTQKTQTVNEARTATNRTVSAPKTSSGSTHLPQQHPAPAAEAPHEAPSVQKSGAREIKQKHRFTFSSADGRVWLLIQREKQGKRVTLGEVILRPHRSLSMEIDGDTLLVSTGNAGGLKIEADGQVLFDFGTLGGLGVVMRHLNITAPAAHGGDSTP